MCVFCKIINGEIPSYKVYEDSDVLAILDLSQATLGHTLVMPKTHVQNMLDCDEETSSKVFKVVNKLSKHLMEHLPCEGINILNNNNEIAGQTVMHMHVHIIPRYTSDDCKFAFDEHKLSDEEFSELLKQIAL